MLSVIIQYQSLERCMLILLVAARGVGEQRYDNDVPGERGTLLPAAAIAPDIPFVARLAPPNGQHLPKPGRTSPPTSCKR